MNSSRTSHLIPTLLTEIIIVILLKLPVESLLRCKSVCKKWYSLISDHHFIKSHYTLSSANNINYAHHRLIYIIYTQQRDDVNSCPLYDVLFDKSINNAIRLENPLQPTRPQMVKVVGSCNGLLCIFVGGDNTLFIYNPSTRATNILPGSRQALHFPYGFGYDETTHDYKVVKIWGTDRTSPIRGTMIYSLKAGSWKEIGCFPLVNPIYDGKFLNGALHWATGDHSSSGDIVSLDLGKETYGEVLQPEYNEGSKKRLTLGILEECLCVLCNYYENRVMDVWVMKVYGVQDSWTKLVSISHPNDRFWDPYKQFPFHAPLCISNDRKLLLQFGKKLVVYDCINASYSEIQNFDVCNNACIVVDSLISPFAPLGLGDEN